MRPTPAVLVLALLACAAPARADEEAPPADPVDAFFAAFDADRDGAVTRRELAGVAPEVFALLDRDGDGSVRREEVARRGRGGPGGAGGPGGRGPRGEGAGGFAGLSPEERAARLREGFARRDADGDGFLAGEEAPERLGVGAYVDGDGRVCLAEYTRHLPRLVGGRRAPAAPDAPRAPEGPRAPDPARPPDAPRAPDAPQPAREGDGFAKQDLDGDGRLNRTEWRGSQDEWLRLDRDRDGWVTREEAARPRAGAAPEERAPKIGAGAVAPDFSLPAPDGTTHTLAAQRGKWVVLEWINYDCPFVRKHYEPGHAQRVQRQWRERGVVWFSVCSSGPGKPGHMDAAGFARRLQELEAAPTALLMDPTGATGKAYGARTTPHLFVIDPQGRVAYQGAFDDRPGLGREASEGARCFVSEVLEAGLAGREIPVADTRSYG
jgi:hypothetical protein